jgi:preprotein translocase subunit YajC
MLDPLTIGMLVVLAILVFFMFRNSRKRQRDAAALQQKVQVGADVMTNFGVYGTILEIDEEDNKVLLETSPGTVLTVHRQTVTRVIDDHSASEEEVEENDEPEKIEGEPAYGQRIEETASADGPATPRIDPPDEADPKTKKVDE